MLNPNTQPSHPLFHLPPEIRIQIYTHILDYYFSTPPFRKVTYTALVPQSWNPNWRFPPLLSHIPPFERALIPLRYYYNEFFSLRMAQSIIVLRPVECINHDSTHSTKRNLEIESSSRDRSVCFAQFGKQISPLMASQMRDVQYLTYVHNPLLEEISIDKNAVALELGKSLYSMANFIPSHASPLQCLTISCRTPYYSLYQKNYEFERAVLLPGIEAIVKQRGLQKLILKRDDGQGWRGTGSEFGESEEELNKRLEMDGKVEMIDDISNIRHNRSVYSYTGVSETWEGVSGAFLTWKTCEEELKRPNLKRLISS